MVMVGWYQKKEANMSFSKYKVDNQGRHVYDKDVYDRERDQEKIYSQLVELAGGDERLVEEASRACRKEVAQEVRGGFLWMKKKIAVRLVTDLGDVVKYIVEHNKKKKTAH